MTVAEQAQAAGLRRVGARPPLGAYLAETWRRRDFAVTLARFRLQATFETNRLGAFWIVLQPTLNAAIYGLVFGVLQGGARPANYISFIVIGVFLFNFFSGSMINGAKSITGNRSLVQSLSFPRITLPLSAVIEQLISLAFTIIVMLVIVMIATPTWPRLSWLLLVPLLALFTIFNTGIALICARLTTIISDFSQLLPYLSRILMYVSGVLWSASTLFKGHHKVQAVLQLHPILEGLDMARGILLGTGAGEHPYPTMYWAYLSCWAVGFLLVGTLFFWVAEEEYGRVN